MLTIAPWIRTSQIAFRNVSSLCRYATTISKTSKPKSHRASDQSSPVVGRAGRPSAAHIEKAYQVELQIDISYARLYSLHRRMEDEGVKKSLLKEEYQERLKILEARRALVPMKHSPWVTEDKSIREENEQFELDAVRMKLAEFGKGRKTASRKELGDELLAEKITPKAIQKELSMSDKEKRKLERYRKKGEAQRIKAEEEKRKLERYRKKGEAQRNKTEEEKNLIKMKKRASWQNRSTEQKKLHSAKTSERLRKWHANKTEEEKEAERERSRAIWANRTEEEKEAERERSRASRANRTEEEKRTMLDILQENRKTTLLRKKWKSSGRPRKKKVEG